MVSRIEKDTRRYGKRRQDFPRTYGFVSYFFWPARCVPCARVSSRVSGGSVFFHLALCGKSGRLHCVLCRSVSGARLGTRFFGGETDRHTHTKKERETARGVREMLYGSAAKRSLARHPIKPRGSATLTVSNCERTLTDIERESFLSLFRSTEALGSEEEERECVMISAPQNRGLFCHFFFFPKARSLEFLSPRRFPFSLPINFRS
jgi:hypothetical protein